MTCEEVRENLEAYVLGALEADEQRAVAAHLQDCPACAELERAYDDAASFLTLSLPLYHASPRLKERILAGIGAVRPAIVPPAFLARRWVMASAAAVLLAFAVGGMTWAVLLSREVSRLKADNASLASLSQIDSEQRAQLLRLQGDLNSAQNEQSRLSKTVEEQAKLVVVALDPGLIPSELQGTSLAPSAHCNYVWSGQQGVGALTCKDLPVTALSLTYELWGTKGDKNYALGAFTPRTDNTAILLVKFPSEADGPVSNMWITLEQANSSRSKPSDTVVLQRAPAQQATRP